MRTKVELKWQTFSDTNYANFGGSSLEAEIFWCQAGLPDDRACRADGYFFFGMRNDGNASGSIAVFGVAALLRHKHEAMLLEHTDDLPGSQPFRHSPTPALR